MLLLLLLMMTMMMTLKVGLFLRSCGYDCCAVVTGELPHCRVTTHEGAADGRFIASSSAQPGSCGSENSPWVVEAGSGQKLRFTLHDFAVQPAAAGQNRTGQCFQKLGWVIGQRVHARQSQRHIKFQPIKFKFQQSISVNQW